MIQPYGAPGRLSATTNASPSRPCNTKNCGKHAIWRLDCTQHPNGGMVKWYCHDHLLLPAWEDAPSVYTLTVSGPHR